VALNFGIQIWQYPSSVFYRAKEGLRTRSALQAGSGVPQPCAARTQAAITFFLHRFRDRRSLATMVFFPPLMPLVPRCKPRFQAHFFQTLSLLVTPLKVQSSCKLCHNWLRHWNGTLAPNTAIIGHAIKHRYRASNHRRCQRSPKGLVTTNKTGIKIASKHARKHEACLPWVNNSVPLVSNDFGFICADVSNVGSSKITPDIIWVVCYKFAAIRVSRKNCPETYGVTSYGSRWR